MPHIPRYGEYYWAIFSDLTISKLRNNERDDDERRIAGGNAFPDQSTALRAVERVRKVLADFQSEI